MVHLVSDDAGSVKTPAFLVKIISSVRNFNNLIIVGSEGQGSIQVQISIYLFFTVDGHINPLVFHGTNVH
ncbi:hypothetical protein D9M70_649450 [compost metagenome]